MYPSAGTDVYGYWDQTVARLAGKSADYLIELSLGVPEVARAAAAVIPGQLLGFHTGMRKGFNPDNPRHLSRVVMLESSSADGDSRRGAH